MFSAIEVEINSDCNRKCWYCPNSKHIRIEKGEMDSSLFIELMEQLKSINYCGRLSFHFYGEPLLCKNLDYFVRVSKKYLPNVYLKLFSNGDFLDENKLRNLIDGGVDEFVLTQHTGEVNMFFKEILVKLPKDIKERIISRDYKEIEMDFTNRGGLVSVGRENVYQNTCCGRPNELMVVTLRGNVIPCCEDFYQIDIMGNILQQHILEIWNSPKYVEFREQLLRGNRQFSQICLKCNKENKDWDIEQQKLGSKNVILNNIVVHDNMQGDPYVNAIKIIMGYFLKSGFARCRENKFEGFDDFRLTRDSCVVYLHKYGIIEREKLIDNLFYDIRTAIIHHRPILVSYEEEHSDTHLLFYGIDENSHEFWALKIAKDLCEVIMIDSRNINMGQVTKNRSYPSKARLREYYTNSDGG